MRNIIILGSGRSGTSMVAGTLAKTSYFMGNNLIRGRDANPKGFFEDREINKINDELLAQVLPKRLFFLGRSFFNDRPIDGQRWLARLPLNTSIPITQEFYERIHQFTQKEPYCFKDPRFSYTLPVWRPHLKNIGFLCIFREPGSTANSILKECKTAPYLRNRISINFRQAIEVWTLMYSHILEIHRHEGEWLFLHFNQVLNGEGIERLESFTEAPVDFSFPDPKLRRSSSNFSVPERTNEIYQLLCEAAEYKE